MESLLIAAAWMSTTRGFVGRFFFLWETSNSEPPLRSKKNASSSTGMMLSHRKRRDMAIYASNKSFQCYMY